MKSSSFAHSQLAYMLCFNFSITGNAIVRGHIVHVQRAFDRQLLAGGEQAVVLETGRAMRINYHLCAM